MAEARKIKTYSNQELPREKLNRKGATALTDVELLQAVIGSGGKGNDFKQIAKNLDALIKKTGVENLTIDDVKSVKGIGDAKATIVFAALEFWRRKFTKQTRPLIHDTDSAAEQLGFIKDKKQEYFVVLTLDGARRLIQAHTISIGTLTTSIVHPREVFAAAIEDKAASIIIEHNHPSVSLAIGAKDREVTKRIKDAGDLMGIPLVNHIVIAGDDYVSAME
jgi:DNA repair protein RadC